MIRVTSQNSEIIGYGKTGFWQSEYKYPDDKEVYGDYSCLVLDKSYDSR